MNAPTDRMQRLLDTSKAADDYAHTAGTRYASLAAVAAAGLAVLTIERGFRGLRAKVIGKGSADNAVINCRVYGVKLVAGGNTGVPASGATRVAHADLVYLGLLVATLSNSRGGPSGSSAQGTTEMAADGLTWTPADGTTTPKGPTDKLIAVNGSVNTPDVYSPANDADDALFLMPDVFDFDAIAFDLDRHTNATESNVLAERTR